MIRDPDKQRAADRLEEPAREARALAEKLGLEPFDVNYWIVDHDEMNELVAYGGFQNRYPHWRWGMQYDRQRKQRQYLGGKAFELVNNDNPAHAFLQESNALADQKAVITHVEAHSDFFANNQWFGLFGNSTSGDASGERSNRRGGPNAAAMLERHSNAIEEYLDDPDVDREDVERFIDTVLTLEDNIEHRRAFDRQPGERLDPQDLGETLSNLGVSDEVREEVFDREWLESQSAEDAPVDFPSEPVYDVLAFLREHGMSYDEDAEKAVEFEDWQRSVLEFLRRESYYFAPQQMTKVMNEGWAAFWESLMMGEETFADDDEFIHYADHQAMVLNSPGFNPYQLGKQLWEYVENQTNRREVVERLLCVDGITPDNFYESVDFEQVRSLLEPDPLLDSISSETLEDLDRLDPDLVDYEALDRAMSGDESVDVDRYPWKVLTTAGLAHRHYSLVKPQFRGFLERVSHAELEEVYRYQFDVDRYTTVEDAIADVDRSAGWDRMFEVRESHNDVTFIDEFLTQEFVEANDYFTYEHSKATGNLHATSVQAEDVKKKLLLRMTNLGKPRIAIYDANHQNAGELLLRHEYNGVILDVAQAEATLQRVFELWGRPVTLHTITKRYDEAEVKRAQRRGEEPEPEEVGVSIRYDGEAVTREELDWAVVEDLAASDLDYDTKPEDWL